MNQKPNSEKSPAFSLQLGKELVSFNDTKLPIIKIYAEVGMTDWEIHLNKTMLLRENDNKVEIKKTETSAKKLVENVEVKKTQNSDYWLS